MSTPPETDDSHGARPGLMAVASTVNVEYNPHGAWEIDLPDGEPLVCETLEEAQRIAYLFAVQRSPCELTVHDAYHRLILHRVIDADDRSGPSSPLPPPSPAKAASVAFAGSGRPYVPINSGNQPPLTSRLTQSA